MGIFSAKSCNYGEWTATDFQSHTMVEMVDLPPAPLFLSLFYGRKNMGKSIVILTLHPSIDLCTMVSKYLKYIYPSSTLVDSPSAVRPFHLYHGRKNPVITRNS
jgi:hypothetical protein